MNDPSPRRNVGGLIVVVILGLVFFALLGLLIFSAGKKRTLSQVDAEQTLTVLPPTIRLRTEPNAKAPVVATATTGEKLEKLEDRAAWVHVKDPDGIEGWTERGLLERSTERDQRMKRSAALRQLPPLRAVATERTALYAGPGIFYPVVGELAKGASVQVYTRDHDFYVVNFGDQVAYADIDVVNILTGSGPQYSVKTIPESSTRSETAPPVTEVMEPTPPAPAPPAPEPVTPSADASGVYAAVPPGGTQPLEVDRVIPRYPPDARAAGVGGAVVIRGIVRKDGTIDNVEILRDLPRGLGEEARRAVEQWKFRAATYHGEPIDVYYTITVNFKLQ